MIRGITQASLGLVWVCAALAVSAGGCRQRAEASPRSEPPAKTESAVRAEPIPEEQVKERDALKLPYRNLLLITVDALRADQPWEGYTKVSTPNLSRLAQSAVVYDHAYSLANTTGPSLSALLSARYASEIPRDDCPLTGLTIQNGLAETLAAAGIHTMAAHAHVIFAAATRPSRGFEEWKLVRRITARLAEDGAVTGKEQANDLIQLLRANASRRFFAWAHFLDPHHTYARHPDFPRHGRGRRAAYDAEVAYTDNQLGRVFGTLDELGLSKDTAVIVTADHGEGFGEHGRFRHGYTVYQEEIHVPLMLRLPGVAPRRMEVSRSLIDLARTVVELMGVEAPESWRGKSLLLDLQSGEPEPRDVLVDVPKRMTSGVRRAWISGDRKVVWQGNWGLAFDLAADPEEKHPLPAKVAEASLRESRAAFKALSTVPASSCTRTAFRH